MKNCFLEPLVDEQGIKDPVEYFVRQMAKSLAECIDENVVDERKKIL